MKFFVNTYWSLILLFALVSTALAHDDSEETRRSKADQKDDEEYNELKSELAAYTTVLRQLERQQNTRRSLSSTACWKKGGICIERQICGYDYDTLVPGCTGMGQVCCYRWNKIALNPKFQLPMNAQQQYVPHQIRIPTVVGVYGQ